VSALAYFADNLSKIGPWLRSKTHVRFFLNRALWESGFPWTRLRPTPLETLFPGIERMEEPVELVYPFRRTRGTSMELEEMVVAATIARFTRARRVVEIGTFDGNTALNLAANLGDDGRVVTLDLPPEGTESGNGSTHYADGKPAPFAVRQYLDHPMRSRIRQVYGDSATIDWRTLGGPFDLALIDGDHTTPYVLADTRHALSVLAPGGIVLWHDYEWRSVSAAIDTAVARGEPLHWIRGTRLAIGVFPRPAESIRRFEG
jgi:predicted O-methyltransferase YrrM